MAKPRLSELERSPDHRSHYVSLNKGKLYETYLAASKKKDIANLVHYSDELELYRILMSNQDSVAYSKLIGMFEGKAVGPFCYIKEKPMMEKKEEAPLIAKRD
jgi:hypothetical protein